MYVRVLTNSYVAVSDNATAVYVYELRLAFLLAQVTQALEVCETELKALHESYVEMLAAYEVASSGILPSSG
jgi:hypothetical protein